jgi:hypothetical protein
MDSLTEYETETGQIFMAYSFPSGEDGIIRREGFSYVSGFYTNTDHYIHNGEPTERPTQSTTLDGRSLTGLPVPALLHIDGETYTVDNGEAELEFPLPGTYRLRVEAWPFKDWEGEVTVPVLSGAEA